MANLAQTGWPVPKEVKRKFMEFCESIGGSYQDQLAGAMTIWRFLPAQIREDAVAESRGAPKIDQEFWVQFEAGLRLALQTLAKIQLEKQDAEKLDFAEDNDDKKE